HRVLEDVPVPAEPGDDIKLTEERTVLYEQSKQNKRIKKLLPVVGIHLLDVLAQILHAPCYRRHLVQVLLENVGDPEFSQKTFVSVIMNDLYVSKFVT